MNARRACSAGVVTALTIAGFLLSPPSPAFAARCSGSTPQDFDGDDHADLVIARTLPATREGVVDIRLSGGGTQTLSATTLGYASAPDDRFGAAVAIGTVDTSDNCPDLVIGAPGSAGGGAVYLVRGAGAGVATTAVRIGSPAPDARFGTTVATADLPLTRVHLLVGAPGMDVGAATDAGALLLWQLSDGTPSGPPATLTYQDFGAVPAPDDHLGSVLDVASWHLTLGVPDRDVGAAQDAGEVVTSSLVDEPDVLAVTEWTRANQDSPGAPGTAEAGDRFGASVDFSGAVVFVGVPGEDIAAHRDAGAVVRYTEFGQAPENWASWTQNSPGVPGNDETGDRFGAAVHIGWIEVLEDGDPFETHVYLVGAPGEDIGRVRDAGAVTVLAPGVKPAFGLSQGAGLPGRAERGDQVGAAFGDFPGEYSGPYYGGDGVLVGAPGEDVGTVVDAGLVMAARGLLPRGRFGWRAVSNLGTLVPGARYGWTLPSAT